MLRASTGIGRWLVRAALMGALVYGAAHVERVAGVVVSIAGVFDRIAPSMAHPFFPLLR